MKKNTLLMILLGSLMQPLAVLADQYHYKDILIGDRASGFGGAYTAISDDPSGLYYNPAGIVRAPDGQLSASANAFNQTSYTYSNINSSDKEWVRRSNASLANFFGVFQPLGSGMLGFSIAAPDINKASQDETFNNYQAADPNWTVDSEILNYKEDDSTVLVGPTYALNLSKQFSMGLSLYTHIRNAELEFRQDVRLTNNGNGDKVYDIRYQKFKTNELGLKPILGLAWDPSPKHSLGLKIAKTFILDQTPLAQQNKNTNAVVTKNGNATTITLDNANSVNPQNGNDNPVGMVKVEDRELPLEASIGFAWFPTPYFIFSADVDYFSETKTYAETLNYSAGTEYFWSPQWSTRTGIYTNNSNNKSIATETGYDVDELGISISVGKHNRLSVMTFGFNYLQGEGKARLNEDANFLQNLKIQSITAYIATSMNF